ncbi:hypothetical protein ACHAXA_011836 [Cyclostephanos tholiformis]|uniref:Uncharacterized protein n=1 Tax=Cyclostephanos tholiformis TaxID=382380 RepID=A0ABD3RWD9_9STRA
MVVYPDLVTARIRTVNPSWHATSSTSMPPRPPPSSDVLKRAIDALSSSFSSASYVGGMMTMGGGGYAFEVEEEVLARAREGEGRHVDG